MLTRRNYVETAAIIEKYRSRIPHDEWVRLVEDFIAYYNRAYPDSFDSVKFRRACYGHSK